MPDPDSDQLVPGPRTSIDGGKGAGLYDDFEAYRTPTEADYHKLFTTGLIIPDTNVFLNLYRYNEQTRNDLLAVLGHLGGHLWVPHQVMEEFWRNRETVLKDPQDADACINQLSRHREQATGAFRAWANRVSLPQDRSTNLRQVIEKAFDAVIHEVSRLAAEHSWDDARDTNTDRVLGALESLLDGHVGRQLDQAEHDTALQEAKSRAEQKRPPGYKDHSKTDEGAAGDYLIWVQVLREAKARQRDVLLITGDVKEDWWRREHGEARGPRPELVRELKEHANVKLYMLRPESLLLRARQALKIEVRDESLQDAERVDRSLTDTDLVRESWEVILDAVRGRRRVAAEFLGAATVDSMDEDVLTVRFRRSSVAQQFIDSGSSAALSDALHEVLGIERRITVVVAENRHLGTYGPPRSWTSTDTSLAAADDPADDGTTGD
ncbi:MAG: PIN-like domain-containing protein [Streptosporangiaceae bacterium]